MEQAIIRLGLQPSGPMHYTQASVVCEVVLDGHLAFLKVTNETEELTGTRALEKWEGNGAVKVLVKDGHAVVLERAGQTLRSLVTDDAEATRVLCAAADRLHTQSPKDINEFLALRSWFSPLFSDTAPRFDEVREIADRLFNRTSPPVLLHGDLHHENVLDGEERGWLAIDPKGVVGPREFDYCNIFTNWSPHQAHKHFDSRLHIVAKTADIDPVQLLSWIAAWSALSGIWHLEDGNDVEALFPHSITDLALHRLHALSGSHSD